MVVSVLAESAGGITYRSLAQPLRLLPQDPILISRKWMQDEDGRIDG